MDSRERVLRALTRTGVDRIPMMDAFWEDTWTNWHSQGLPRDVVAADYFDFDIDYMFPDVSPRLPQRVLSQDDEFIVYEDRFGYTVKKAIGKSRTMHFMKHVTRDRKDWEQVKKGFVLDRKGAARIDQASYFMHMEEYPTWAEAGQMFQAIRRRNRYLLFNLYGPWEATWRHRGYEDLLIDIAEDADFVAEMAATYMDFAIEVLSFCLEQDLRPDGIFLVDDLAYVHGLLISPGKWRQIFKPLYRRLGSFLQENGLAFWMHCCGNAEVLFEDFIECGLQVIQPLEAKSGLDVRRLRQKYGNRLAYWGNIDVIKMASGSDAEIEEEIRSKIGVFQADRGGYIYHSDHSVPPEVSFERYKLVWELVRRYGTY